MIGQLKIPLYTDENCTQHAFDFGVMILSYEESRELWDDIITAASYPSGSYNLHPGGMLEGEYALRYKSGGFVDGTDYSNIYQPSLLDGGVVTSVGTLVRDRISKLASKGLGSTQRSNDIFNICALYNRALEYADGGEIPVLYTKFGGNIRVNRRPDSTHPARIYADITFRRGTTNIQTYSVLLSTNLADNIVHSGPAFMSLAEGIAQANAFSDSTDKYAFYASYMFIYLVDGRPERYQSNYPFVGRVDNIYKGDGYRPNTSFPSVYSNTIETRPILNFALSSDSLLRLWANVPAASSSSIDTYKNKDGFEYIDHGEQENDDDSYPGGGNDKNVYPPDGESGKGTFDNTNDPVDWNPIPTFDATTTGFISMWNPNLGEITQLYRFLWTSQIDVWEKLKNWFGDPMEAIISLGFVPVDPTIDGRRNVTIGLVDSGIQMNHISKQFVEFDFGTLLLDEYYGAAWDFSPYTKVQIYLPYIGVQELDVDDVMGATLHLKYFIDLLSGATSAQLKCTRTRDDLNGIVYTWEGNCLMRVPVTSADARQLLTSIMQTIAIGGLALVNPAAGALSTAMNEGGGEEKNKGSVGQWVNPTMSVYNATNVLGQKLHVQRGSRVDANAGVVSPQCAYLIIGRPVSAIPKGWNEYAGYPSLKIRSLSSQKGYTQVAYIKLNGLEATADEISELDSILKGGVIL